VKDRPCGNHYHVFTTGDAQHVPPFAAVSYIIKI
jgi:hypothetical protein